VQPSLPVAGGDNAAVHVCAWRGEFTSADAIKDEANSKVLRARRFLNLRAVLMSAATSDTRNVIDRPREVLGISNFAG
jgi:hypothetical protein